MRKTLQETQHLTIRQAEVSEIITTGEDVKQITGVRTVSGATYHCKAVVLCTGTYLNARCLTGEMITYTGPNGLMSATHLTQSLKENGVEMYRFKTGTPARVDKNSLDFSKMQEQKGDERVVPFSFTTNPKDVQIDQVSCWLTYTNETTHEIIRNNLDRSPIYAGIIEGTGPSLQTKKDIRFSSSRKESTRMRCMLVVCLHRFRRMYSMRCIVHYRVWKM